MNPPDARKSNILSDVEVDGSITFQGELIFDGTLRNGDIKANVLTLGPNAKTQGNVEAAVLTLYGAVSGDVLVTGMCELKGSATLVGSLTTNRLVMDDGATFIGQAEITPDTTRESVPAYEGADFPSGLAALRNLKS